ncbi:proline hydroxylase [Pseudomonas oryzihabitans]|nr:proline hydroxylase [Pseudomonas psychrotolerans]
MRDFNWAEIQLSLDNNGYAILKNILSFEQCEILEQYYFEDFRFRSRVVMARHGFGSGEYKYFRYPLPPIVENLRHSIYPFLAPFANSWNEKLKIDFQFPENLALFLNRCRAEGQALPTPLILKYFEGDYNCLHQDLYGEIFFPFQMVILLSELDKSFSGGEFIITEKSASGCKVNVITISKGDAIVFSVNSKPVSGKRRYCRAVLRHGVSAITKGTRTTLGVIFHDGK